MTPLRVVLVLPVLLAVACGARAAEGGPASPEEILAAVVHVRAEVPADAHSAAFLGTEREGSGVLIREDGLVLTIGYLVLEASRTWVRMRDDEPEPARVLAHDLSSGLALLHSPALAGQRPVPLGDSSALAEGDPAVIVSHDELRPMQPARVVSRRTFAGYWEYLLERGIFTAPPYEQFAGAALISRDFALVGIGSLFVGDAPGEGAEEPGNLFVPVDLLPADLSALLAAGRPPGPQRPWLGVNVAEQFGRVLVIRVTPGGPAARAGLAVGDIILAVGEGPVTSAEHFFRALWGRGAAGVAVPLRVLHGTEVATIEVTTADRYERYGLPRRTP